jgi:hypothetical protein
MFLAEPFRILIFIRKMKVSRVIHMKEITNISVMFGGLRKMTDAIIG